MLRLLRIIGIIIFAFAIGYSANSLKKMHESGDLLDRYNSQRRADLTLLGFSVLSIGVLGCFEFGRIRRLSERHGYGGVQQLDDDEEEVGGLDSTSIYAAPKTIDAWKGRRTRNPRHRHKPHAENGTIWMHLLRLIVVVLPLLYLALMVLNILVEHEEVVLAIVLPSIFGMLLVLSIVAAVGIFSKKSWGMMAGYTLAVCNLLIFPYGTAVGLFLILGLVGASPVFAESAAHDRHHKKPRRKHSGGVQLPSL